MERYHFPNSAKSHAGKPGKIAAGVAGRGAPSMVEAGSTNHRGVRPGMVVWGSFVVKLSGNTW